MKKAEFYKSDSGIQYAVIGDKTYSIGEISLSIYDCNVIDKDDSPSTEDEFFGALEDFVKYVKRFEKEVEGATECDECIECYGTFPKSEMHEDVCQDCAEKLSNLPCDPAFNSVGDSYRQ